MQYIEPIISALLLVAYIFIATKQGKYIKILKETNKQITGITTAQSGLIKDFETYRQLINVEDFKKNMEFKIENEQLRLSKEYNDKEKAVVQAYLDKLSEQEEKITGLYDKVEYYKLSSSLMSDQLKRLDEQRVEDELKMDVINQRILSAAAQLKGKSADWLKHSLRPDSKDPSAQLKREDHSQE